MGCTIRFSGKDQVFIMMSRFSAAMMDLSSRHMVEVKAATEVAGRHLERDLDRFVRFF